MLMVNLKNKKSIVISLIVLTALLFMFSFRVFAIDKSKTIYITEDGSVVNVIENNSTNQNSITNVPNETISENENISYGDIIERNGVKERVFAIAEDGSFITEIIE